MSAVKSGILDVFACDSSAYDVFAPTHSPVPPGAGSSVWLPAYATLSHNMLEFRHDPRLFKKRTNSPVRDSPPKHEAEAPRHVFVNLQAQEPLGLHISGGSDFGLPVFISKLSANSVAERCAELYIGDEIQAVNGAQLTGRETHSHVADLLQAAVAARRVDLVVQYSREMVRQCENIVDALDERAAAPDPAAAAATAPSSPGAACRRICVPLNGMSVWRQAAAVFDREMCALIEEPDRRSQRCFGLTNLSDPACLFRARSLQQAEQWCAAIQENVRGGLRETLFAANAALHGHHAEPVSNLQHLAWMRVRTLADGGDDIIGDVAAARPRPSGDIRLVAVTDTSVAIYGSRSPPACGDAGMTSPERSEDDRQVAAEEHMAFWSSPEVVLPIVHSRIVEPSATGGSSGDSHSLASAEGCVILRTGVPSGLERRLVSSEHAVDLVLWKMEFRKAWQTVPSVVGRMKFPVVWHGEQCKVVLDPHNDSIAVFVGDCKEKMLTVLFNNIKRTSDDGRQRFQIWLDSQSCLSFQFEGSFKLFQTAFISFLAYHKSNLASV